VTQRRIDILIKARDEASEAFEDADESLNGFNQTVGAVTGGALGGAAFAAVEKITEAIKAGIELTAQLTMELASLGSELQRSADLVGIDAEQLQKLAFAAKTVGIEQDKLADIFKDVNDKVGDFLTTGGGPLKDFFEQIAPRVGVTAEAFRDLSGPDALQLYAKTLEEAGVNQQEFTFFMEAIASDATMLAPLLRNNSEGFRVLGEEAEAAGLIMSNEATQGALDFTNQLDELNTRAKAFAANTGFISTLAEIAESLNGITSSAKTAKGALTGLLSRSSPFAMLAPLSWAMLHATIGQDIDLEGSINIPGPSSEDLAKFREANKLERERGEKVKEAVAARQKEKEAAKELEALQKIESEQVKSFLEFFSQQAALADKENAARERANQTVADTITAMEQEIEKQNLLLQGKEKEAGIQERINQLEKSAGRELTEEEKKRVAELQEEIQRLEKAGKEKGPGLPTFSAQQGQAVRFLRFGNEQQQVAREVKDTEQNTKETAKNTERIADGVERFGAFILNLQGTTGLQALDL